VGLSGPTRLISDPEGRIVFSAPPAGTVAKENAAMERFPILMLATTTAKDAVTDPVRDYVEGERYDVGADLRRVFVDELKVALDVVEEPAPPAVVDELPPATGEGAPGAETKVTKPAETKPAKNKPKRS